MKFLPAKIKLQKKRVAISKARLEGSTPSLLEGPLLPAVARGEIEKIVEERREVNTENRLFN